MGLSGLLLLCGGPTDTTLVNVKLDDKDTEKGFLKLEDTLFILLNATAVTFFLFSFVYFKYPQNR